MWMSFSVPLLNLSPKLTFGFPFKHQPPEGSPRGKERAKTTTNTNKKQKHTKSNKQTRKTVTMIMIMIMIMIIRIIRIRIIIIRIIRIIIRIRIRVIIILLTIRRITRMGGPAPCSVPLFPGLPKAMPAVRGRIGRPLAPAFFLGRGGGSHLCVFMSFLLLFLLGGGRAVFFFFFFFGGGGAIFLDGGGWGPTSLSLLFFAGGWVELDSCPVPLVALRTFSGAVRRLTVPYVAWSIEDKPLLKEPAGGTA